MKTKGQRLIMLGLILFLPLLATGEIIQSDSVYVQKQENVLVTRLYLSSKFTDFLLKDPGSGLRYLPNSGLNLGLGLTFRKLTLNLAFPPKFLNPNRKKDWPRYLDLQAHIYPEKWIIDLFGQFYNGYSIRDYYASGRDYLREDMKVRKLGFNAQYIFNGEKISFAAAMQQSEMQKRSAISTMLGFEAYRVIVKGDSLLLPDDSLLPNNFTRGDFLQFGPNAGVVGTLVFGRGFFITAALSGNLAMGYAKYESLRERKEGELVPSYFLRGFAGYNSEKFSVNINYVYKRLVLINSSDLNQSANTGNYRLNVIYKLHTGQKFRDRFSKLDPRGF